MKVRVLYLISTLANCGPTNVIYTLVKYLDRTMIEPVILTLSPETEASRIHDFRALGVEVHSLNLGRMSWLASVGKQLRQQIEKIEPDVVHSHSLRADVSAARHLASYRTMATIHSDFGLNYRADYNWVIGGVFERMQIKSIKRLDKVVACSRNIQVLYQQRITGITCIQNGVDIDLFNESTESVSVKMSLGFAKDDHLIVYTGSLTKGKDPETIIKGFLKAALPDPFKLILVGNGPLADPLRKKYQSYRNITFAGQQASVVPYLRVADLFVSASLTEGLPNAVIEALACGVPVCLSDIPSHGEILSIDHDAGILFSVRSYEDLASKMIKLLKGNLGMMKVAARRIVEQQLNAKRMARQYQEEYIILAAATLQENKN